MHTEQPNAELWLSSAQPVVDYIDKHHDMPLPLPLYAICHMVCLVGMQDLLPFLGDSPEGLMSISQPRGELT